MLGYDIEKCGLDFSNGQPDTFSLNRQLPFYFTNASICDTTGQLLFYSNGIEIENYLHTPLSNSNNFNTGWGQTFYAGWGLGYYQGVIILPDPGNNLRYYLIYISNEQLFNYHLPNDTTTYEDLEPFNLNYSLVDMSLDSGRGGIVSGAKDISIINDTLLLGRLTACKHANGRDWWLITRKYNSNIFYKVLITPSGISVPSNQSIGNIIPPSDGVWDYDVGGQAFFSPDGEKFAVAGFQDILDIYDFDRCTGLLNNQRSVFFPDTSSGFRVKGLSFSPNSRFVYVSNNTFIYQYDSWSSNIDSSKILVAQYDNFANPLPTYFFMHQIGQDNKIYINMWGGDKYMHVINAPDSLGLLCNVTQHSLVLSKYNNCIPNFPNYNLGRLIGSPCDTITAITENNSPPNSTSVKLYPNPASTSVHIQYHLTEHSSLQFLDITGRVIKKVELPFQNREQDIDVSNFSNGSYFFQIVNKNQFIHGGKLIVVR